MQRLLAMFAFLAAASGALGDEGPTKPLRDALTLHVPFDEHLNASFSSGSRTSTYQQGQEAVPATVNEDVRIVDEGRFGKGVQFTRKSAFRPQFDGRGVLGYSDSDWDATVSVWLKLDPDRDLEPGYCDPVQILGDDSRKGFIFLEWSKDHTPRHFRFAARPLVHIWNPDNVGWEEIPEAKRPMVKVERAPFSADRWTHAVFTLENLNSDQQDSRGKLYLNGELQGAIEGWDLEFGWDAERVRLVLGASYVGQMDDLAVFNRALSDAEIRTLYALPGGVGDLHP